MGKLLWSRDREDLGAGICGEHGVFEMRGGLTVGGDVGPTIGEGLGLKTAEVNHGLDRERHAGLDFFASAAPTEVGDLWGFMHRGADAVADHIANDAEAVAFAVGLNRMRDIADTIADLRLADTEVEGFTRDAEKFFEGGRNRANGQRGGVVADVAVMPHDDVE